MGEIPFRERERIEHGPVMACVGQHLPQDIVMASVAAVERKWCSTPPALLDGCETTEEKAERLMRYLAELTDIRIHDDEPEQWSEVP